MWRRKLRSKRHSPTGRTPLASIRIENLRKGFGALEVLKGIDLDIVDGEFVCFLGPSGCGKSTLLRSIAGLEELDGGSIRLGDRDISHVPSAKRDIAMVFQNYALNPHMNVHKNLSFGLALNGMKRDEIDRRVESAAEILRIKELLARKPRQLSGGQRQRVAIGRAIVRDPVAFLFDEPRSNLDAARRVAMRLEISELHQQLKRTMIYVTHDQVEAMTMADKIVVLRLGRIEQVGSPLELYNAPRNLFVAGFMGSPRMNFLKATIRSADAAGVEVAIGGGTLVRVPRDGRGLPPGTELTLGVRPEHLDVGDGAGPSLPAVVNLTEHLGGVTFFYSTIASDEPLTIEVSGQSFVDNGVTVPVRIDPRLCHLFDKDGLALEPVTPQAKAA